MEIVSERLHYLSVARVVWPSRHRVSCVILQTAGLQMLLSGSLRLLSLAERQGAFSSCQGAAIGGQGAFRGGQGAPVGSARNLASATQIPKKPRSPWVDYFVSNYPAVKKTHPDLKTAPQVMKKVFILEALSLMISLTDLL